MLLPWEAPYDVQDVMPRAHTFGSVEADEEWYAKRMRCVEGRMPGMKDLAMNQGHL